MDNYEVVIERTVRDLYRSSSLSQIKKFKINKEKEIVRKDEELRNLILEKYPVLIKSISSLEKISSCLNDLQEIRQNFNFKVGQIQSNLKNKNVYEFDQYLFNDIDNDSSLSANSFLNIQDKLRDEIDEAWKLINNRENYNSLIMILINIKNKIENPLINDKFLKENFYFILLEFMEILMKDFISTKNWIVENNNQTLEIFFIYFYTIYTLLGNEKQKLYLSDFYLKLQNDILINNIFQENFKLDEGNFTIGFYTFEIMFKLVLLKLSKCFNLICNSFKEEELLNYMIDVFMYCYQLILILNASNGTNTHHFPIKKIIKHLHIILSIDRSEDLGFKISNPSVFENILQFIKNEVNQNLENKKINNSVTFWINMFSKIYSINEKKNIYSFLESNDFSFIKNSIDENEEDYYCLYNFIFMEKSLDQVNFFLSREFDKISNENHINSNSILKIYSEINKLNLDLDENSSISKNKKFINTLTDLLFQYTLSHLEKSIEKINSSNKISNFVNFLVNLYSNKQMIFYIKNLKFQKILISINKISEIFFDNEIKELDEYLEKFKMHILLENCMDNDCYSDENNSFNTKSLFEFSNYLITHCNYNDLEFEDLLKEKIKTKILETSIKNFVEIIESFINNKEQIINKRIINDIQILNKTFQEFKLRNLLISENIEQSLKSVLLNLSSTYDYKIDESNKCDGNNFYDFFTLDNMPKTKESKRSNLNTRIPLELKMQLPFNPRLSIYIINRKNQNNITQTPSNLISPVNLINSTSKLLEFRIDENYLSLKGKNDSVNNKNDSLNSETKKNLNLNSIKLNTNSDMNRKLNEIQPNTQKNSSTAQDSSSNIKGYLGYFGGMIKDNISNIKGLINTNDNPIKGSSNMSK